MRYLLLSLLILCFLPSCEEETAEPLDTSADQAYFPLTLNEPLFYVQDSIVLYNTPFGVRYDTSRAEIRETLVERLDEADGTVSFRGERWQRRDADSPWVFVQTYTVQRTDAAAFRTEDNLRFTKMLYPIRAGRSWDGNAAFDENRLFGVGGEFLSIYRGWNYRYETVDTTYVAPSGRAFPEAVYIQQAEDDGFIDLRRAYEVYAPGVGLVERFVDVRSTQCRVCCSVGVDIDGVRCDTLPWNDKAEKGFILRQTIQ